MNVTNPWEDIKQTLITGLASAGLAGVAWAPFVGVVIAPFVNLLFPKPGVADVWDQIKKRVEDLIDKKLDETVYSQQKAKVTGLSKIFGNFTDLMQKTSAENPKPDELEAIRRNVTAVQTDFVQVLAELQNEKFAVISLPMYALAASLYAAFLKLVVGQGKNWGMGDIEYNELRQSADVFFNECDQYMLSTAEQWRKDSRNEAPKEDERYVDRYNYNNKTESNIVTLVDDFRIIIKYTNPATSLEEVNIPPEAFSDIFSDAYGTHTYYHNDDEAVYHNPLANMEKIHIGYFNHHAVNLDCYYPAGKGPLSGKDRVDKTTTSGGYEKSVEEYDYLIPAPPQGKRYSLAGVTVRSGDLIEGLTLLPVSGDPITLFTNNGGSNTDVKVPGRMLSTINAIGRSNYFDYNNAISLIIFGFSRDYAEETQSVRAVRYIAGDDTVDISDLSDDIKGERERYLRALEQLKLD